MTAEFESVFPLLAWQLLFVHGLVIGYHRERLGAFVERCPRFVPYAAAGAAAVFMAFAFCNPRIGGPSWLHLGLVSPARFTYLYEQYFGLTHLGIGRLVNLAVGLPLGYGVLTWAWKMARPLGIIFVTLGQRSLGAFVLHVYGLLALAHLPHADSLWTNTLLQVILVVAIAAVLNAAPRLRVSRRAATTPATAQPLAA